MDSKQVRAFEGFVTESGDALLRMATLLTSDPDAAEDIALGAVATGAAAGTAFAVVASASGGVPRPASGHPASAPALRLTAAQTALYRLSSATAVAAGRPAGRYVELTEKQDGYGKTTVIDSLTGDIWPRSTPCPPARRRCAPCFSSRPGSSRPGPSPRRSGPWPSTGRRVPWPYETAARVDEETFESPQTGAVLETAFVYRAEGTTGTDLYLSITGSSTPPPDPYHR